MHCYWDYMAANDFQSKITKWRFESNQAIIAQLLFTNNVHFEIKAWVF